MKVYGTYQKFEYQTVDLSAFKNGLAIIFKVLALLTLFAVGVTLLITALLWLAPYIAYIVGGVLVVTLTWEHFVITRKNKL